MVNLLKVFVRGIIVTLLLPVILVVWVAYGVYCLAVFIFMLFKNVIEYFMGKSSTDSLPEDIEARKILLSNEKAESEAQQAAAVLLQNALNQVQQNMNQPAPEQPQPTSNYGENSYSYPEPAQESPAPEEKKQESDALEELLHG